MSSERYSVDYPSRRDKQARRVDGDGAARPIGHEPAMRDEVGHADQPEPAVAIFQYCAKRRGLSPQQCSYCWAISLQFRLGIA